MTNEEIEEAINCCAKHDTDCENCPYYTKENEGMCVTLMQIDLLSYINRLKAENVRLGHEIDRLNCLLADNSKTIEQYEAELARR